MCCRRRQGHLRISSTVQNSLVDSWVRYRRCDSSWQHRTATVTVR
jgi:hypothetical protein